MTTIGKNIYKYMLGALCIAMTTTACKKDSDSNGSTETPQVVIPAVRPQGTSLGPMVAKQIGAAGGTLQSADKSITLTIPAGALSTSTAIVIEPITNTNIAGMGNAFRLRPHGQQFAKPVAVTFSWAASADTIGLLQTLGLAYQQQDGIWKFVGANSLDKVQKTVTFQTRHFSDWSLMNEVSLYPYRADVDPGGTVLVQAAMFVDISLPGTVVPMPDNSNPTGTESGYPVGFPIGLPPQYVKAWHLNGPGKITPAPNLYSAQRYEAPSSINDFATAAVSLELNAPDTAPGQYLLVSNINIRGGSWIELSIAGSEPFTFPASPAVHAGNKYLLSNPENEGGGHFLLQWTDGLGIHPFTTGTAGTYFHWLSTDFNINYVSMYRPDVQSDLLPSGGSVNITKVSDGRAEGTFNVTDAGYGDNLTQKTTAQGRFKVKLVN